MSRIMNLEDISKLEYLFISYAKEDYVFVDWLAKKLTALGYNIWIDKKNLRWNRKF